MHKTRDSSSFFQAVVVTIALVMCVCCPTFADSEASLGVQIGPKLENAFRQLARDDFDKIDLIVEINGGEIGTVSMKSGAGEFAFGPLETPNRIRFLLMSEEESSSLSYWDLASSSLLSMNPFVRLSALWKMRPIERMKLFPSSAIQQNIFEFEAARGSKVMSTFDISADGSRYELNIHAHEPSLTDGNGSEVGQFDVAFDPQLEERPIASEVIETPRGVEQEYEISRTFSRSVNFNKILALELAGSVDLRIVEGEVRARLSHEKGQVLQQSETIRRNLRIRGVDTPKLKVVWIGVFRKGAVSFRIDGKDRELPFALQTGLKLELEVIE